MRGYTIGQVCKLLEVKPHVLRYWEREVPLLSPQKDKNGRRVYSRADLQILFRLRYLLYKRGYTLAGAKQKIFEESTGEVQSAKAMVMTIRSELLSLLNEQRELGSRLDTEDS